MRRNTKQKNEKGTNEREKRETSYMELRGEDCMTTTHPNVSASHVRWQSMPFPVMRK